MDFFSYQEAARKKTGLILFYFAAAVVLIVVAVYLAATLAFYVGGMQDARQQGPAPLWDPRLFPPVAAVTLALIALGSLYRIAQLRGGGGAAVAQMLGGRLVNPQTQVLAERVLLNVVEEMAIASGVPVPPVYLLEREGGINAFAAGFTPNDAVIGVTRGALETLSRDELQGVIAHEFSHIMNGDMRLNIRLIGVLNGILLLAIIGMQLIRSAPHSRRSEKGGSATAVLMVLGLALAVIGSVGVFFGRLIQAAVSRQREFLADASAVQFTRNPPGLAGALKKIGGWTAGARVGNPKAAEAGHLFFGNALRGGLTALTATHPPLPARIKRIDPAFDGTYPPVAPLARSSEELRPLAGAEGRRRQAAAIASRRDAAGVAGVETSAFGFQAQAAIASVGAPATEHVDYAAALIAAVPEGLRDGVRDPLGALAAVFGLLLSADPETRGGQIAELARRAGPHLIPELKRLEPLVSGLAAEARLPLVESAMPALQRLSPAQYQAFRQSVRALVEADARVTLFEYALQRVLVEALAPRFERRPARRVRFRELSPLLPFCSQLLSTLAYAGGRDEESARSAFAQGAAGLEADARRPELIARGEVGFARLDEALDRIAEASPPLKKRVLEACARCVGADARITLAEGELLRVVALSLDCPMPPLAAAFAA